MTASCCSTDNTTESSYYDIADTINLPSVLSLRTEARMAAFNCKQQLLVAIDLLDILLFTVNSD